MSPTQGLESCLKGPDNYNSQVLIEATVIALTKLQPLLSKVSKKPTYLSSSLSEMRFRNNLFTTRGKYEKY